MSWRLHNYSITQDHQNGASVDVLDLTKKFKEVKFPTAPPSFLAPFDLWHNCSLPLSNNNNYTLSLSPHGVGQIFQNLKNQSS